MQLAKQAWLLHACCPAIPIDYFIAFSAQRCCYARLPVKGLKLCAVPTITQRQGVTAIAQTINAVSAGILLAARKLP